MLPMTRQKPANWKKLPLFLFLLLTFSLLAFSGCELSDSKQTAKIAKLVEDIHDKDVETTFLYNTFEDNYWLAYDSEEEWKSTADIITTSSNANKAKAHGKNASEAFVSLISDIEEAQREKPEEKQAAYLNKLKLASENYKLVLDTKIEWLNKREVWYNYSIHNQLSGDYFNEVLKSDARIANFYALNDWGNLLNETKIFKNALKSFGSEIDAMKRSIPFSFLDEYKKFVNLSNEYADGFASIATRILADETIKKKELEPVLKKGSDAGALLIIKENNAYVKGEEEGLEEYKRTNFYPLEEKSAEAYNKADAYYGDAKLKYEALSKAPST